MGLLLHIIIPLFFIVLPLDNTGARRQDTREMPETNVKLRPIVATGGDCSAVVSS